MTNIFKRFTGGCWKWKAYLGSGSRKRPVGRFHESAADAYATYLEAKKIEEELPARILTLGEAVAAVLLRSEQECSPHTLRGRKARVKRFFDDADAILSRDAYAAEVTPGNIREALVLRKKRHKVENNTLIDDWAFLHLLFREAGIPDGRNPVRQVRKPDRDEVRMDFFTSEELDAILHGIRACREEFPAADAHADILEVLAFTGLRSTEFARLRIADVEFSDAKQRIGGRVRMQRKRGGVRSHPFAKRLVPVLKRMIGRVQSVRGGGYTGTFMVGGEMTGPYGIARICTTWTKRLVKRKIACARKLSARTLRHTYGTQLIRSGVPVPDVQRLLGHANLTVTERYLHATQDDLAAALVKAHH